MGRSAKVKFSQMKPPPAGGVWEFCEFWSLAKTAAPKSCPGKILTLLAFGTVSLRLLDLGVPEGGTRLLPVLPDCWCCTHDSRRPVALGGS